MRGWIGVGVMVALLSGCGAKVVFGDEANGGSGGTGQGGFPDGPGPGPGPGPGSGGGVTTGPGDACQELCAQFPECIQGTDCYSGCKSLYTQGCESEVDALIRCATMYLTHDGQCALPPGTCDAEAAAYAQCSQMTSCTSFACSVGDAVCSCDGDCNGLTVTQSCTFGGPPPPGDPPPPQNVFCDCFIEGGYVGSCGQDQLDCSLEIGCCQALF